LENFSITNNTDIDIPEINELNDFLKFVIDKENLDNCYFDVVFVNNKEIKEINKKYRNKDKVTDVISFALQDDYEMNVTPKMLGDIYISIDKAYGQAREYKHTNLREVLFLALHGLLHLLGYDHIKDDAEMFEKQEVILNEYGIKRWKKKTGICKIEN